MRRQIQWLSREYEITAAGLGNPEIEGVHYVQLYRAKNSFIEQVKRALFLGLKQYDLYYEKKIMFTTTIEMLSLQKYDLVIANDIDALPLALKVSCRAKVFVDLHEYSPREFEDRLFWRLFYQRYKNELCRKFLPLADAVSTVSEGIAKEYQKHFGVLPEVITNASDYKEITPSNVSESSVRIVHHGGAMRSRRLETMIEMVEQLDERFTLDLMLMPSDGNYLSELKLLSQGNTRIRFLPPVAYSEIVETLSSYDIGLYILEPNNFNNRYALPNKIFEFVQARLCIAIGPSPEMAKVVRETGCGVISEDFSSGALASIINSLSVEQIMAYKEKSHQAARSLSSNANCKKLRCIVANLLGSVGDDGDDGEQLCAG